MKFSIPDDATVRAITDHNGNLCGYIFARHEFPRALRERIENPPEHREVTFPHVTYHTRAV